MEYPNDFDMILRQILSKESKALKSKDDIARSIHEMEVMQLLGDRWLVWLS